MTPENKPPTPNDANSVENEITSMLPPSLEASSGPDNPRNSLVGEEFANSATSGE